MGVYALICRECAGMDNLTRVKNPDPHKIIMKCGQCSYKGHAAAVHLESSRDLFK